MFDNIARELNRLLDGYNDAIVQHLSCGQNKIKIQIKIQSVEDVSLELETYTKNKLVLNNPPKYKIVEYKTSSFKVEQYQRELKRAVCYYVTTCRFYSLPLTITIFVKSDNSITGNLVSDFVFKEN